MKNDENEQSFAELVVSIRKQQEEFAEKFINLTNHVLKGKDDGSEILQRKV